MNKKFKGKIFGVKQLLQFSKDAAYALTKHNKEMKLIDKNFKSQLRVAVSEVNGCRYCSYAHTKQALKSGSTEKEINSLLAGDLNKNAEMSVALVFAQHYADTGSNYDKLAFKRVQNVYGMEKANGILAIIKVIMAGNISGIAFGFLIARLKGKKQIGSSFINEVAIIGGFYPLILTMIFRSIFIKKAIIFE